MTEPLVTPRWPKAPQQVQHWMSAVTRILTGQQKGGAPAVASADAVSSVAQDADTKISAVDQKADAAAAAAETKADAAAVEQQLTALLQQVAALPTANDLQALAARVDALEVTE